MRIEWILAALRWARCTSSWHAGCLSGKPRRQGIRCTSSWHAGCLSGKPRRQGIRCSLPYVLWLLALPLPAHAAEPSPASAYQHRQYAQAEAGFVRQGGYAGRFGAGAAAWRLQDYRAAVNHFGAALLLARSTRERDDALYNLGNAHYGMGRWRAAAEAFASVAQTRPNDARARKNLEQANIRLAKQRGDAPFQTDLRGRRGRLAEGVVNLDWDSDAAVQDFAAEPLGPMSGGSAADGARRQGSAQDQGDAVEVAAARLQSGLKKLELLDDKPRELLKGMLRQDRVPGAADAAGPAW